MNPFTTQRPTTTNASLPPIRTHAASVTATSTLLGIVVGGVAVLTDQRELLAGCVVGVPFMSAAAIAAGIRTRRRAELTDRFILAVSSTLGWREPSRDVLRVKKWSSRWIGHPTKFRVHYSEVLDDTSPTFLPDIATHAKRRLGTTYAVERHDARKTYVTFVEKVVEAGSKDFQIERVKTMVAKIFGPGCKVETGFDKDGLHDITVGYEVTPRLASSALRHRVEMNLSSALDGRWRAHWDLQHDRVRFEVRPALPGIIPNPSVAPEEVDPLATYDSLEVPYAVDEDGNVLNWRPKRDPHMLIVGKTGKGKTVVELGIVGYLAAMGWEIWGIDGKRIEFLGLRSYPNVSLIAGRIDHQARVAHQVYTMMQQRFEDYEAGRVRLEDFVPVLFFIDEYKTFRNALTRWYRSVKPKGGLATPPALDEISDFMSLARKVRMHCVLGTQRPDAEFLTGDMRDNFGCRISLGRLSPDGAKMMWDSYNIGVTVPLKAIGRGTAYNQEGIPVEVQAYWTPDPYQTDPATPENWVTPGDLEIVQRMRPRVTIHQLKQIVDPDDFVDLDGESDQDAPNYNDYMATRIIAASAADEMPVRKAAGVYARKKSSELTKLQIASQEVEEDDTDLFAGYGASSSISLVDLVDSEEGFNGAIALVDADNGIWGLIDGVEPDLDDGYVALDYRDLGTGEPSSISLPEDEPITIRTPEK